MRRWATCGPFTRIAREGERSHRQVGETERKKRRGERRAIKKRGGVAKREGKKGP